MPSLDSETSDEEVSSSNFGQYYTNGHDYGAYAHDGEKWTEGGSTRDQEAIGEQRARPS